MSLTDSSRFASAEQRDWAADDARWSQWMAAAQQGDAEAYERLLSEVDAVIRRFLASRFGRVDFIDDIAQDCLLSIHKGRHTYDANRPFRGWLFAIVRHRAIDHMRDRSRRRAREQVASTEDAQDVASADLAAIADASVVLKSLTPKYRDVVVLTQYLGFSAREAASWLGISVVTVRVRLHRALHTMRAILDDEIERNR